MKLVPLSSVCSQTRRQIPAGERADLRYIGLESIEAGTGQLASGELSKTPEAPRASSFHFTDQHVLYSKLRPYLNKVWVPDFEGKSSTELVPLLPSDTLDRRYLAYFLRSPGTVQAISARTVGARMPRADMDFLLSLQIPLPSIEEQRRIVDLLSRAEGIVRLRREAQAKAAEIIPALFLDMFGDPGGNKKEWPVVPLGEAIASIDSGKSPKCHDRRKAVDEWGVLKLSALSGGNYNDSEHKTLPREITPIVKNEVLQGDVLISRKNTNELVGTSAYVWKTQGQLLLPDLIFRLKIATPAPINPIYLWQLLSVSSKREALRALSSGSAGSMPNISKARLRTLPIEVPPMSLQSDFSRKVEALHTTQIRLVEALTIARATFQSLLYRSFAGA